MQAFPPGGRYAAASTGGASAAPKKGKRRGRGRRNKSGGAAAKSGGAKPNSAPMARAPRRIDEDEVDDDETMRLMDEGMMVDEGSLGSYYSDELNDGATSDDSESELSRSSINSSLSARSFPRAMGRDRHRRGVKNGSGAGQHAALAERARRGYLSETEPSSLPTSLRSELRKDMKAMVKSIMWQKDRESRRQSGPPAGPSMYGSVAQTGAAFPNYTALPMYPQPPPPPTVGQSIGGQSFGPFLAGCLVSCVVVSYSGLFVFFLATKQAAAPGS